MPTDGADFGRMKACYGKVYTALRAGVDDAYVADLAVQGVERDIRRDGGVPVFDQAVSLVVLISGQASGTSAQQLVRTIDVLARTHGDSSLSRHVLSAAEKVALTALNDGSPLSRGDAAERILVQVACGRCEGMSGYATRHRTHSIAATEKLIKSVSNELPTTPSLKDLACRMLNASAKGLPAKAPRESRIDHSAESLNNTSLDGAL